MMQLYTFNRKRLLSTLLLQFIFLLGFAGQSFGQTQIFRETMGTEVSDDITIHENQNRFDNDNFTMSGNAIVGFASQDNASYPNASKGNIISLYPEEFFQIDGINTTNLTGLSLSVAMWRDSNVETGSGLSIQFSTDGSNWQNFSFANLTTGSTPWEERVLTPGSGGSIPAVANLRLRFSNNSNDFVAYEIDDIRLVNVSNEPTITSFSPISGPINTIITILGSNLQNVNRASLGTTQLTVISSSATEVKVQVTAAPSRASQPIRLLNGSTLLVTSSANFNFIRPTITSMSPMGALVGTEIVFIGTELGTTSAVHFAAGADAEITFTSPTEIRAKVPANAISGQVQIITAIGTAGSPQNFTVYRPIINSISSTSGREGETVIIRGTRLLIGGTPTIRFGGNTSATIVGTPSSTDGIDQITVTVPVGAQTGAITLTTTEGSVQSGNFTVIRPALTFTGTPLAKFEAFLNNSSAVQQYQVTGSNMNSGLSITAPQHFEIATTNSEVSFAGTAFIPMQADNTIALTTIFVRYKPTITDTHTGNISHISSGLVTSNVIVQGVTIAKLPVELISFTAEQQRNSTLLKWATASEKDNAYFDVEMSDNAAEGFTKIDKVESKVVNSNTLTKYTYKHLYAGKGGTRYYRLKQNDLNGMFKYSNVVSVETQNEVSGNSVRVAPNPLNYSSKVYFTAAASGKATLRLTAIAGKQVYQKEVDVQAGENGIQLPVYDTLKNGIYVLTIEVEGKRQQVKVVKQ
ncbi:IPT/TIG domain-containing protein [Pontibacter arcticus]|uniref:IPT/TIG domain-containing protein n=1 Tax=Pontibacter arcticus TaxID=2080288 RepID=A0A364RJ25_9BACT|nr:IPT/TIG domain-containing protein [Pontibacter arcticus]RAU84292.1 hypothetical protein DP923_04425 [Pontibacter arcticus]